MIVIHWTWILKKFNLLGFAGLVFFIILKKKKDYKSEEQYRKVRKHEKAHLKQAIELFIIPWWILYIIQDNKHGYGLNAFEREANMVEESTEKRKWFSYGWVKFMNA